MKIPNLTAFCLEHDAEVELVREPDGHWYCPICFSDFGDRNYPSPVGYGRYTPIKDSKIEAGPTDIAKNTGFEPILG